MLTSSKFDNFLKNIRMSDDTKKLVSDRYKRITKKINEYYWSSTSETDNSLYVGSIGRRTNIYSSDIDILVRLPWSVKERFDKRTGNIQSQLLQEVKECLNSINSRIDMKGDGQVVSIKYSDGMIFEVVPVFQYSDGSFCYTNSKNGGSWESTNPKAEQESINKMNNETNKNLKMLCRMTRIWKEENNVPISGWLIDTLAYNFIVNWTHKTKSSVYYDYMSRDFFEYLKNQYSWILSWNAPGSNDTVGRTGDFEKKSEKAYENACLACDNESTDSDTADYYWRRIYGNKF